MAIDSLTGNIYFTESSGNKIGRLVPSTNTITEWNIPTDNSGPKDLVFDSVSSVYFIESKANKIGRFDVTNAKFYEYKINTPDPTTISSKMGFRGIIFDNSINQLYYLLNDSLTIGKLDISTNTTTDWKIVFEDNSNNNEILSLTSVYGDLFFIKNSSNKIGRLVPSTNTITEWNIPTDNSGPKDISI